MKLTKTKNEYGRTIYVNVERKVEISKNWVEYVSNYDNIVHATVWHVTIAGDEMGSFLTKREATTEAESLTYYKNLRMYAV